MKMNKQFIKKCNQRIIEKEPIYGGRDNPLNYKNVYESDLLESVGEDFDKLRVYLDDEAPIEISAEKAQLLCIDMANRLSMIWEKINADI